MEKTETPGAASPCLECLPLAMAYVPMQQWGELYTPSVALDRGTLFPPLDLPFLGGEATKRGS